MKTKTLLASAILLMAGHAHAQSTGSCPTLPANSGTAWERLEGNGYTFCKAIRDSDGHQVLAVMITGDAPFKPRRANRIQEARIDGDQNWWYRSELSGSVGIEVRETLVELDSRHVAHISARATNEQDMSQAMSLAEALRFDDVRVSIN